MIKRQRRRTGAAVSQRHTYAATFRRARLQLTAWYVLTLAAIVVTFSMVLYVALAGQLSQHQGEDPTTAEQQQIEQDTSDFALSQLRLLLVAGNILLLLGGTGGVYILAGKTLRPIAAALERQRRFTADASHKLRTPLTIMRGTLDVALQRDRSTADYREVLDEIREEVDAMTSLVEQLLRLARGDPQNQTEICDVRVVVAEVVQSIAEFAASRGSTVSLSPSGPLRCAGDRVALRQLFLNLVRNALQHSAPGVNVQITANQGASDVEVLVSDNGPGIPEAERERVFEPFARLQTTGADGLGLGLALSRELAEANGSGVTVEETQGGGATFRVRLPRSDERKPAPATEAQPETGDMGSSN